MYRRDIMGIVFALIMAVTFYGCGKIKSIPDELLGTWETSESRYANTYFEFGLNTITFKDKEGNIDNYTISSIKMKKAEGNDWYEYMIKYKNEETKKVEFSFYYDPTNEGSLRFKNQELIVWHKKNID